MKIVFETYENLPLTRIYEAAEAIIEDQYPKGTISLVQDGVMYCTHSGKGRYTFLKNGLIFEGYRNSLLDGCDLCYVGFRSPYHALTLFIPSLNFYTSLTPTEIETSRPDLPLLVENGNVWLINKYYWEKLTQKIET